MSNSTAQGLYSPLPQSISDSDSEEELHSAVPTHSRKLNDKQVANGGDKDYHHLDDGDDAHMNGFPNVNCHTLDDIPIIKDGYKKPMSALRKFFFIVSILICFLTIVIFLWVLPCSDGTTCSASVQTRRFSSWDKSYHELELMGPINIVNGVPGHSKNLVFLFRANVIITNSKQESINRRGGAISIIGDSGMVAWYISLQRLPSDIDCSLLDADNNGEKDCIFTGENGLFEVINPTSGEVHWNVHIHSKNNTLLITSVDFPLIVPDVDNDHVNDLLTSCSIDNGAHNIIIIISGTMGSVLGKPYPVSNCDSVHELILKRNNLSYTCKTGNDYKKMYITLRELYLGIMNKTYTQQYNSNIKQYSKWDSKKNIRNQYYVNGRRLEVNNQGHCPGSCSVSVQLIASKGDEDNIAWSYTGTNMYGMVPTKLSFKNNKSNILLQGHVNGYILKFWQWVDGKSDKLSTNNYVINNKNKRNILDSIVQPKLPWYSPTIRTKRSLPLDKTKNFTEQLLIERVVIITYNTTNFNIVNVSQSDIRQLCTTGEHSVCQPDLASQENSVLLSDLDEDGSQELISYLTTFVLEEDFDETNNGNYQLQSIVKVVRLEKELTKLYEDVNKN